MKARLPLRRSSTPAAALAPTNDELWRRYRRSSHGGKAENDLVEHYRPLVKSVVGRLAMNLPAHVSFDDLCSVGMLGLLNALRQFKPAINPVFETYARVRIRGAVLDELRRMDWAPRSVHRKARRVEAVMRVVEQEKGRIPSDREMAAGLDISLAEYQELLLEIRPATFISLDAQPLEKIEEGPGRSESLADPLQANPRETASTRELAELILKRLRQLPDNQRKVLALYYFEDLRLREIAAAFGVSESRISQIHTKAVLALRSWLARLDPLAGCRDESPVSEAPTPACS